METNIIGLPTETVTKIQSVAGQVWEFLQRHHAELLEGRTGALLGAFDAHGYPLSLALHGAVLLEKYLKYDFYFREKARRLSLMHDFLQHLSSFESMADTPVKARAQGAIWLPVPMILSASGCPSPVDELWCLLVAYFSGVCTDRQYLKNIAEISNNPHFEMLFAEYQEG